jgi:hypothetical protein
MDKKAIGRAGEFVDQSPGGYSTKPPSRPWPMRKDYRVARRRIFAP